MNRDEFRALTPWSFFLPVTLAVILGVLVANALGAALFGDGDTSGPEGGTAEAAAADGEDAPAAAEAAPAKATAATKHNAPAATLPTLGPVSLPGPSSARRDGETRACIGGTVAVRAENGWEQEVINDAPARCIASSR